MKVYLLKNEHDLLLGAFRSRKAAELARRDVMKLPSAFIEELPVHTLTDVTLLADKLRTGR